jgi:hypothetical protein
MMLKTPRIAPINRPCFFPPRTERVNGTARQRSFRKEKKRKMMYQEEAVRSDLFPVRQMKDAREEGFGPVGVRLLALPFPPLVVTAATPTAPTSASVTSTAAATGAQRSIHG